MNQTNPAKRKNPLALESARTRRPENPDEPSGPNEPSGTSGSMDRVNKRGEVQGKPAEQGVGRLLATAPRRGGEGVSLRDGRGGPPVAPGRSPGSPLAAKPGRPGRAAARTRCAGLSRAGRRTVSARLRPRVATPSDVPGARSVLRYRSRARTRRGADAGGSDRPPSRACR